MKVKPVLVSSHFLDGKRTLRPLTTPALSDGGRLILAPTARSVAVLAEQTGHRIATILAEKDAPPIIQCIALLSRLRSDKQSKKSAVNEALKQQQSSSTRPDMEHYLLLGCSDGEIRQVSLDLGTLKSPSSSVVDCGSFQAVGPCVFPEQKWKVVDGKVCQLSVQQAASAATTTLHVLVQTKNAKSKRRHALYRVEIPFEMNGEATTDLRKNMVRLGRIVGSDSTTKVGEDESPKKESRKEDKKTKKSKKERKGMELPKEEVPFFMSSAIVSGHCLVVVASPGAIHVFYDDPDLKEDANVKSFERLSPKRNNHMTALSISADGRHVAVGYLSGEIHLLDNLLSLAEQYLVRSKGKHPAQAALVRKLHWHAHPVASLEFSDSNRFLYSGGEESVLVTWQLEGGTDRPTQVLPRVALGGIDHIVEIDNRALLFCRDNSLQLLRLLDQSRVWKHQGLAIASRTTMQAPPKLRYSSADVLQIVGPPLAPGYMHWYDTREMHVVQSLEIAPFNRVSRTEPGETPMPTPMITHAAYSQSGDVMVTCEITPTENAALGVVQCLENGKAVGMVTTLRFWSSGGADGVPYELSAAMSFPHGTKHRVSCVCVSADGKYVCTISNDENAFRVWQRSLNILDPKDGNSHPQVEWTCQYRVTTPAGYSRHPVHDQAVAFSPDASIIAISYGRTVTLWDRKEMALLSSVSHVAGDRNDSIKFLKVLDSSACADSLLTATSNSLSLQSPFGSNGPIDFGWVYQLQSKSEAYEVTDVHFIRGLGMIVVSLFFKDKRKSDILLINAASGEGSRFARSIQGKVVSIVSQEPRMRKSCWTQSIPASDPIDLFVLTEQGEMLALHSRDCISSDVLGVVAGGAESESANVAPKIPLLAAFRDSKNRVSIALDTMSLQRPAKRHKSASNEMTAEEVDGATGVLLSAAYARSFLARHLQRQ